MKFLATPTLVDKRNKSEQRRLKRREQRQREPRENSTLESNTEPQYHRIQH